MNYSTKWFITQKCLKTNLIFSLTTTRLSVTNLYNSDQMLKIELDNTSLVNPLQCADVSGVTTACNFTDIPSPTPTTSAICNNAVKQVSV